MATKNYSAKKVSFTFGPVIAAGFAKGDQIRIANNSESFNLVVGNDGLGTRYDLGDGSARITLLLLQSSDVNDALSAILNADVKAGNGSGIAPLTIRDQNGRAAYFAEEAWIVGHPQANFALEPGPREWVFECTELERFDGGNN